MNWYKLAQVVRISLQDAIDKQMFGPVYHGTSQDAQQSIQDTGFNVPVGEARSGGLSHGYENTKQILTGIVLPVHHLGFGVYFTTAKSIAKDFAGGSARGMKIYYLDVPRLETINWGSPNTMAEWWIASGYDPELAKTDRVAATQQMTQQLASQFDAVWYKGKGLRKLLDGDQVCVYDPSKIYEIDKTMAQPGQSGSNVRRKTDNMLGTIMNIKDVTEVLEQFPGASSWIKPDTTKIFTIKWRKGGTEFNVQDTEITFA